MHTQRVSPIDGLRRVSSICEPTIISYTLYCFWKLDILRVVETLVLYPQCPIKYESTVCLACQLLHLAILESHQVLRFPRSPCMNVDAWSRHESIRASERPLSVVVFVVAVVVEDCDCLLGITVILHFTGA